MICTDFEEGFLTADSFWSFVEGPILDLLKPLDRRHVVSGGVPVSVWLL